MYGNPTDVNAHLARSSQLAIACIRVDLNAQQDRGCFCIKPFLSSVDRSAHTEVIVMSPVSDTAVTSVCADPSRDERNSWFS